MEDRNKKVAAGRRDFIRAGTAFQETGDDQQGADAADSRPLRHVAAAR